MLYFIYVTPRLLDQLIVYVMKGSNKKCHSYEV